MAVKNRTDPSKGLIFFETFTLFDDADKICYKNSGGGVGTFFLSFTNTKYFKF